MLNIFLVCLFSFFSSSLSCNENLINNYFNHQYDAFLEETEKKFQKAREEGVFEAFLQQQSQGGGEFKALSETEEFRKAYLRWDQLLQELETKRNAVLSVLIAKEPSAPISQTVHRLIDFSIGQEEKEALKYLFNLNLHPLSSAKNSDEKQLMEIERQYAFKMLLVEKGDKRQEVDPQIHVEHQAALALEKMDAMKKAAQQFQDTSLQERVERASHHYYSYYLFSLARSELLALAEGGSLAKDPLTAQVQEVMKGYLKERKALYQQEFLSQLGLKK